MTWYEIIIAAHLAVTNAVSHAKRLKSDRYFVWEADGAHDLIADGKHVESAMTGRSDLFTKKEFDPWAAQLGEAFDAHGVAWTLYGVDYEEDTGFWHYTWDWEVCGDGDDTV